MKILNFYQFKHILFEGGSDGDGITIHKKVVEKPSEKETIYPERDKKTGTKTIDKSQLSKEAIVNGLAKELYKAQYKAVTLQMKIDKTIAKMTEANPDDPNIAIITAGGAIQVANAQLRADTIEQQMLAAAMDSEKLTQKATEMAAEAKNLAMKAALKEFDEQLIDINKKLNKE